LGHYKERFIRNEIVHLPDEMWVGDSLAEQMASEIFPGTKIVLIENPYFNDIKTALARLPHNSINRQPGLTVLFVCEPISEHSLLEYGHTGHWGYTEYDALRYFLQHLDVLDETVNHIIIRPHPSELADKYKWVIDEFGDRITLGGTRSLLEEIADCDVMAGCESMAMVIGLLAQKRVISCIPPGGKPCILPQKEIEPLSRLIASFH
jgi:hypothetical protein